jgi:putative membrane protein
MYSFFYLKSYWDPYGNLTDMKIAIVNLDEGEDGENQGKEFIKELVESGTFNINDVSEEKATKGLEEGKYYAVITIPSNFTSSLNSAGKEEKQMATITYTPNKASNYLAIQIINSAIKTIEINLQSKVSSKVVGSLTDTLEEIPESLEEISDGTGELLDGTESLSSGLKELNDGVSELSSKYTEFDNGVNTAYNGSTQLESGINQVNSGTSTLDSALTQVQAGVSQLSTKGTEGISSLTDGADALNSGAAQLAAGTSALVAGTASDSQLGAGAQAVAGGLAQLNTGVTALSTAAGDLDRGLSSYVTSVNTILNSLPEGTIDATQKATLLATGSVLTSGSAEIKSGLESANSSVSTLSAGATAVSSGIETLNDNAQTLNAGAVALSQGATQLASSETKTSLSTLLSGISSLQSGINQVKDGTSTLKSGTEQLVSGSNSLTSGLLTLRDSSKTVKEALDTVNNGTNSAYDGSLQLIDGIKTLKSGVDDGIADTKDSLKVLDGLSDFVENPVEFKEESYGEVDSYGIAFTPLFLCIGLWVGALMCYVVLYYDKKKRFGILDSESKNKYLQNLLYLVIGAIDGIITSIILKLGLGLEIENLALYVFASAMIGVAFMSIIQFLIRNFGDIGKFLGLIILVLQLAASGGTFPVETIDKGFRGISPFLPMTYTIKLLKEILIPSATNYKLEYFIILIAIIIVCTGITYIVDIVKKNKGKKKAVQK